jgi:hypothetical protein
MYRKSIISLLSLIVIEICRAGVMYGSRGTTHVPPASRDSLESIDGGRRRTVEESAIATVSLWAEALSAVLSETAQSALRHDELQQLYDSGTGCSTIAEDDVNITDHVTSIARQLGTDS